MNYELFNKAQSLYDAKDFQGALMAFTQCLQDEAMPPVPGETGRLYHQIGNCLIKLRDANEAIQAYTQAVADSAYDMKGAVDCNLGMAYASLHDYDNAVRYFAQPGCLLHGSQSSGGCGRVLRERVPIRYASGDEEQAQRESGSGIRRVRRDGEGRHRI